LKKNGSLVIFSLDNKCFALNLSIVERVIQIVKITSLPEAPDVIQGLINIQGNIIPVINMRKKFHMPDREVFLSDQLILAHTSKWMVALMVDCVTDVAEFSEKDFVASEEIVSGLGAVGGVIKIKEDIILIFDLEDFFSFDERKFVKKTKKKLDEELSMTSAPK